MTDYLTDLDVNQDKDIHLDSANDLTTTGGLANLEQSVGLVTMDITSRLISGEVTGENLALLEERIRQHLNEDPHVEDVLRVEARTFNRESGVITLDIFVDRNKSFTIKVSA